MPKLLRIRIAPDGSCLFRAIGTAWMHVVFGVHLHGGTPRTVRRAVSDIVTGWLRYSATHRVWTGAGAVAEQVQGRSLMRVLLTCAKLVDAFGDEPMTPDRASKMKTQLAVHAPHRLRGAPAAPDVVLGSEDGGVPTRLAVEATSGGMSLE